MNRMLNRATPMLKAVGTEEATVVFKSGDHDDNEEEDDDDPNDTSQDHQRLMNDSDDDPNDDDDITRSSETNVDLRHLPSQKSFSE